MQNETNYLQNSICAKTGDFYKPSDMPIRNLPEVVSELYSKSLGPYPPTLATCVFVYQSVSSGLARRIALLISGPTLKVVL